VVLKSGESQRHRPVNGAALKLDPDAFVITADDLVDLTADAALAYAAYVASVVPAPVPPRPAWGARPTAQQDIYINAEIFSEKVDRATNAIQPGGTFDVVDGLISTALNQFGAQMQFVENQMSYNAKKIDAMNDGLGALVDADLAKESSLLQALQTRQQLGIQTLGIANQGPQVLLSLFR
jgi:flagellin-like hook-associated protein FlgL